jgi:hypothetical protein
MARIRCLPEVKTNNRTRLEILETVHNPASGRLSSRYPQPPGGVRLIFPVRNIFASTNDLQGGLARPDIIAHSFSSIQDSKAIVFLYHSYRLILTGKIDSSWHNICLIIKKFKKLTIFLAWD